ncbi:39S ribosomal protein L52, mitochondrial [Lingula anatina]|uniref:Large ribosomal subunit protein mL52 n=1 Tax=Lingula anatina TaxID=7574 RepID=A0A1S3I9Q2_LINAN|nr:39S ribosomal protein L52, mitochondrial [Lingula anatina]|eukprot:XP_013394903.1 39S ribosomal protein L52, mitochondrial [Lingula anatina]
MAALRRTISDLFLCGRCTFLSVKSFHGSPLVAVGGKWREKQGLDGDYNTDGPLKNLPDWSFADGRPAPLSGTQVRKRMKERKLAERVVELYKEVQFAKDNAENQNSLIRERHEAMKSPLKPKNKKLQSSQMDVK